MEYGGRIRPGPRGPPNWSAGNQHFRHPSHHSNIRQEQQSLPIVPLIPVNYRKSISKYKRGGRGFRGRSSRGRIRFPKNTEAVPYPQKSDTGFQLKGLLVGTQVFLYDPVAYRFLRAHRGCFGQLNRHRRYEPGTRPSKTNQDMDSVDDLPVFPPPDGAQPVATLNLYEAYFLAIVTSHLNIWDGITGCAIATADLMSIFTDLRPLFPYFFAAYYHFRMLKYVVASGIKFGTDFVLYEYGPLKTHSVYMAYIVVPDLRDPSMSLVDTLQRIANAAKKDALLIRVSAGNMLPYELNRPDCFLRMPITEIIVRRRERIFDHTIMPTPETVPMPLPLPHYCPPNSRVVPPSPFPRPSMVQPYLRGPSLPTWAAPGFRGAPPPVDRDGRGRARRGEGFNFHTVHLGVRRVFRGRSWSARAVSDTTPQYRPPVFRGLGSWCSRRGQLLVRRPGYGIRWAEPAPRMNL